MEDILSTGTPEVVSAVRLRNLKNQSETTLEIDGLFIAIGHAPTTGIFKGQLALDTEGYIQTTPERPAHLSPVYLPRAMYRTKYTVRLLQPQAPAAWQRWTRNGIWQNCPKRNAAHTLTTCSNYCT